MTSQGTCIAVVSGKGGTGKTSFVSGVGTALAQSGRRVLCLDCDIGLRNLDLALGLSDRALMDFSDVAQGRCPLSAAVVEHPKVSGLYLLTAPVSNRGRPVTETQMISLLQEVRRRFDFCLLDAPAGLGTGFRLATCGADRCVVVTTPQEISLADVRKALDFLRLVKAPVLGIVENMSGLVCPHCGGEIDLFRKGGGEALAKQDELTFLGAIPLDPATVVAADLGRPIVALDTDSAAKAAFLRLADSVTEAVKK